MIDKRLNTAQVHMYLLRPFRIEQKGNIVHLPTRKTESLLAYLVLHPSFHSREKLATLFWADSSDASARGSLRKALNFIRKHLGHGIIVADREQVQLNPNYDLYCDATEFERQASWFLATQDQDIHEMDFEFYQNELITDFYDDWILDEREHYHQLYIKVLLRAIEVLRVQSEYNTAIQYANKLLIHDSTNEQAYQHLIFCHIALGDRHGALQQYETCRKVLETGLGVKPARETRALYDWITQSSDIRSLAARVTNLPIPISSFVGRGRELAEIKQLLAHAKLVTLTGVGGSGKTRLAIRVATALIDAFHDGVWWVDLSSLVDENLVSQSVAKSLGVRESRQQALSESIVGFLHKKELLLVLDNCEHLVEACAQLVQRLLTQCPLLKVLTTSREALRVDGEMVYNVPTLPIPQIDKLSIADLLLEYESVKLFVARARAIQDNFILDDRTALLVAQICSRLDGIPLAIELAAARVRTMSLEQITANLDHAFRLLIGGSRTALPRQRTLRAMIDWSYGMLSEQEKILFRRLAIFIGGWSLEAAEEVCSGDGIETKQVFDCLSQLAHKSMLLTEHKYGGVRFYMLETIRQYAQEKLAECAEKETLCNRHLDFFAILAEHIRQKLKSTERVKRKKQFEMEHDNLRAGLQWSLDGPNRDRVEMGARIACALEPFWKYQGYYREGRAWLEKSLHLLDASKFSSSLLYAKTLYSAGHLATFQEDFASARPFLKTSVAVYESIEPPDIPGLSAALTMLAMATPENVDVACELSVEAVRLCSTLGSEGTPDLARSLFWAGNFAYQKGDYNTAQSYAEESRALWQQADYVLESAAPISTLGHIALRRKDYVSARTHYEESLRLWQEAEDGWAIATLISWLGDLERVIGNYEEAGRRYKESLKMWQDRGLEQQVGLDLRDLGLVEMHQGHYDDALKLLKESLPLLRRFSLDLSEDTSIALNLAGLSEIARKRDQAVLAARLLGAAEAMAVSAGDQPERVRFDTFGFTLGFGSMDEYERLKAAGHQQLDEAAWLEGQAMTIDQAIKYALKVE
jgi:predicted ATPase/DNA-binding SARP family transcriptional activator/tetratricopeptide (TPR) repeat protein